MPYALNLTLDSKSTLEVDWLYHRLVQQGVSEHDIISQYGPCVTLLVMSDNAHADDIAEVAARHLRKFVAFPITFSEPCVTVGVPSTLGLRVTPDDGLLSLHNAIYNSFPEQQVHLHYRPAHWPKTAARPQSSSATIVSTGSCLCMHSVFLLIASDI